MIRQKLEEASGMDLSERKAFVRSQVLGKPDKHHGKYPAILSIGNM